MPHKPSESNSMASVQKTRGPARESAQGASREPASPTPETRCLSALYARATPGEKRRIQDRAAASGLSLSRYMVRSALADRPPPTEEERARIEEMLFLFQRTGLQLQRLSAQTSALQMAGGDPLLGAELREGASLMGRLVQALQKKR